MNSDGEINCEERAAVRMSGRNVRRNDSTHAHEELEGDRDPNFIKCDPIEIAKAVGKSPEKLPAEDSLCNKV
jgi:hypothetical protein